MEFMIHYLRFREGVSIGYSERIIGTIFKGTPGGILGEIFGYCLKDFLKVSVKKFLVIVLKNPREFLKKSLKNFFKKSPEFYWINI